MASAELLHSAFERQAKATPRRIAVTLADRSLTYGELNRYAETLATRLRAVGAGPDVTIGICAERCPELVVAVLAALKAGAAYLPIDPSGPRERIALVLADAQPPVLLLGAAAPELRGSNRPVVISLHEPGSWSAGEVGPATSEIPRTDGENLAYVIYTSGSTGTPKGVMSTHRGIVNRLQWMQSRYRLTHDDRVLHKTSIGFDVSVWELLWPLSVGSRLVLARPGDQRHPETLAETIRSEGVTVAHFVPAMLSGFISAGQLERCGHLRAVICSGESLTGGVRDAFYARSGATLHNLYGPTEASIDVSFHACRRDEATARVPIGRALENVGVHVLDERLHPAAPGAAGEICIEGVALARGYVAHPGLTAERFVPNPLGDGTRLYRTGDRGRVGSDGELEFLGRLDDQVKIRGVRVERGEVEAALAAASGVECGAVTISEGETPQLTAYVVGIPSQVRQLRAELADRLPEQAVPSRFVYLDAIPTLANGKVDRAALPVSQSSGSGDAPPAEQGNGFPGPGAELTLARIWQAVLGVQEIGTSDNFFTLGGDSIRSIEVVVRARAAGLELTTHDIFAHQTLGELARHAGAAETIDEPEDATGPFALVAESDRARMPSWACDAIPVSSLLAGLVAESLQNPHYRVYTTTLSIEGPYDRRAFGEALAKLVDRHATLRSAIEVERFSEPLQVVRRSLTVGVREIDLRDLTAEARRRSFAAWLTHEQRTRFDWSQPPLLRVTVHRLDRAAWQLTLSEPFLDGWSATLALVELLALYRWGRRREHPALPPSPRASNGDVVVGERAALRSPTARGFWRSRLEGSYPTRLPRLAGPGRGVRRPLRVSVPIEECVARGLGRVAHDLEVPLKSVLLAAHVWVLGAVTAQRDVLCGLMVNERPEGRDGERAVGLFLNTVPLRVRTDPGSWSALIRTVHEAEAEILPWRAYPYAQFVRDAAGRRLLDSAFNFTHFRPYAELSGDNEGDVKLRRVWGSDQTYFPLTAQFSVDPIEPEERVRLALEINPDGFTGMQVEQLVDLHSGALTAIARGPESRHHLVSPIGSRESRRRALWRARERRSQQAVTTHHEDGERLERLFELQARATPAALAVFDDCERVTFSCLEARVGRLVRTMRDRQVAAPRRVGICASRSPALPVAALAALSVGAAFVPLDPGVPGVRLAEMTADAELDLVLADDVGAEALDRVPTAGRPREVLSVEGCTEVRADAGWRVPLTPRSGQDPAHVIFTSGSTGRPKGVVGTHAALLNRLRWMWRTYPFRPGEVVCARASVGFVDAVTELFTGLLAGVPTYMASCDVTEPDRFARAVAAAGVTRIALVPALLRELLWRCDVERRMCLSEIDHWVLSGEPLSGDLVAELRRVAPRATVLNLYGSTEVAGDVTVHDCRSRMPGKAPAGVPVDGVRVRVLDPYGREAPCGAVGEVAVEGAALAIGYLGDPRATAERFRPSGHGEGERSFRTGDLGRYRPDGVLDVLGRRDRQIKVNGVRIEPAEVEAALLSHPLIRACAVLQGASQPSLVAHVEAGASELDRVALRRYLSARLPSAMVPGVVVFSDTLPRTPSGKVDLRRLPAGDTPPAGSAGGEPHTALERAVAELAAVELGVDEVMLGDDLFELGADSLVAVRLLSRLREGLGVKLALRDVFDHSTLGALCAHLERTLNRSEAPA